MKRLKANRLSHLAYGEVFPSAILQKVKIWDVITHRTKIVAQHPGIATCGDCGRSWDDTIVTGITPAPAGRCPFEGMRRYRKVRQ